MCPIVGQFLQSPRITKSKSAIQKHFPHFFSHSIAKELQPSPLKTIVKLHFHKPVFLVSEYWDGWEKKGQPEHHMNCSTLMKFTHLLLPCLPPLSHLKWKQSKFEPQFSLKIKNLWPKDLCTRDHSQQGLSQNMRYTKQHLRVSASNNLMQW